MDQLTWFDESKKEQKPGAKSVILSASRMTDMPSFYPDDIIREVEKRRQKGMDIHTLVLWTKHPHALLLDPLHQYLLKLREESIQLFIQLTITGMGGRVLGVRGDGSPFILEPNSPDCRDSLAILPDVVELTGNPERIRLRIDPIVRVIDGKGNMYSNLQWVPTILDAASRQGIKNFSFSLLEKDIYQKVERRFEAIGCRILPPEEEERAAMGAWIKKLEAKYDVHISACCVEGFEESRCIDGELLQKLHDQHKPADLTQLRKREKCGCTKSIDIGGWPPKRCYTGCDYCYAHSIYKD